MEPSNPIGRPINKPKYTREQFEAAAKASKTPIVFKQIKADTPLNLVTLATGTYQLGNMTMRATWNCNGECRGANNKRAARYDLFFDE